MSSSPSNKVDEQALVLFLASNGIHLNGFDLNGIDTVPLQEELWSENQLMPWNELDITKE